MLASLEKIQRSYQASRWSGRVQGLLVGLWCVTTQSEALMGHLDYSLHQQLGHHLRFLLVFLLPAVLLEIIAPSLSVSGRRIRLFLIFATAVTTLNTTMLYN